MTSGCHRAQPSLASSRPAASSPPLRWLSLSSLSLFRESDCSFDRTGVVPTRGVFFRGVFFPRRVPPPTPRVERAAENDAVDRSPAQDGAAGGRAAAAGAWLRPGRAAGGARGGQRGGHRTGDPAAVQRAQPVQARFGAAAAGKVPGAGGRAPGDRATHTALFLLPLVSSYATEKVLVA